LSAAGSEETSQQARGADDTCLVRIGTIARAHGLRGAVRVRLDDPDSRTLEQTRRIFVERDGASRDYAIESVQRVGRDAVRLVLAGVQTREVAEELRGGVLLVAKAELPPAGPGEFYHFEAIGCEVVTTAGRRLGAVAEIFATRANGILVVRDGAAEILVPIISDVVKELDFAARRIIVEVIPGLLD
jgi:16S rRNA processing protein RimM